MKKIYVVILFIMASLVLAQDIPSVEELNVDQNLADIQTTAGSVPDTLDDSLLPNETATQLFSYMKWIFSDEAARELAGDTLAPILINLYIILVITVSFTIIWLTIRILVFGWRLVLFIAEWVIKLLELIPFIQ